MYTKNYCLLLLACSICLTLIPSCAKRSEKHARTDFEFVKADKYFVPPKDEVVAILLYPVGDINKHWTMECLLGDKNEAEKIIGKKLKPLKLVKSRAWLEKIADGYRIALKEAEEKGFEKHRVMNGRIIFVTRDKGYIRGINLDDTITFDNYTDSTLLKGYFKELGFVPVRLNQADKYFIPPKDKTVAIFLYSDEKIYGRPPVAIFGNKQHGEKLIYGDKELKEKIRYSGVSFLEKFFIESLEPKSVFEGREQLEKIMDIYEVVLKQAKEDKKEKIYQRRGSIIFITQDGAYIRGIDVGEDTIYDDVTDSNSLKTYFDKLGLTKKLLAGRSVMPKPCKFSYVFSPGEYYAPPAGETVAILLCRGPRAIKNPVVLFGDKELTEKVVGRSIEPGKIFEDRNLLKKIVDAYRDALKQAEVNHFRRDHIAEAGEIFFVTPTEGYVRIIGIDEDTVHDHYMESELLKKYFDEIGVTDEVLTKFKIVPTRDHLLPPTDKVVAILLYRPYRNADNCYFSCPVALIGDKVLTEKLMAEAGKLEGKSLEPKKTIEGRNWLEKIMNAYGAALKEAEKKKFLHGEDTEGEVIFVTAKQGYRKSIGVDANTVYDHYMESELLKKYFDELGLTEELLEGEPNAIGE